MSKHLSIAALAAAGALALAGFQPAKATVVATIVGGYDIGTGNEYDTPALEFTNTSGGTLVNAQMVLLGYQDLNNGISLTVPLANMGAGLTTLVWGSIPGFANFPTSGPPGNLASYDYDDEYGGTSHIISNPACTVNTSLCALVGNFGVTFTAKISGGAFNGDPVFAVFSPTTNFTGGFVGFEGLDPTGLSETTFDQHSGTFSGTMAVVQIGTPPVVPEPSTWAMMLVGFAGLGYAGYRTRKAARAPLAA
jgi:PEP-CTERM motif